MGLGRSHFQGVFLHGSLNLVQLYFKCRISGFKVCRESSPVFLQEVSDCCHANVFTVISSRLNFLVFLPCFADLAAIIRFRFVYNNNIFQLVVKQKYVAGFLDSYRIKRCGSKTQRMSMPSPQTGSPVFISYW